VELHRDDVEITIVNPTWDPNDVEIMVIGTIVDFYYNDMFNQHKNNVKMMDIGRILVVYQNDICIQHQHDVKIIVNKIT
jgi:hypothetical protein